MKTDQLLKRVGLQVRACRVKAGLKQEDVEDFGVSWKHYQKVEAGTTNTTIRILYKLAKAFKCRPGDFLP
ncbi:MAG: helix-turn-helix transcriptional regulator [bacterium]